MSGTGALLKPYTIVRYTHMPKFCQKIRHRGSVCAIKCVVSAIESHAKSCNII